MKQQIVILFVFVAATLGACNAYKHVYSNADKTIDFSKYSTFAWAPDTMAITTEPKFSEYDNDVVRNNVKNYVSMAMTERGYLIDIDSPDLVLRLVLLNEKKEEVVTYQNGPYGGYYLYSPFYFPYYYPYNRFYTWYGWSMPPFWYDNDRTTYTKTYIKGTITINVFDRRLQRLVWTGSAEGNIYDPSYIHYDVHPAVNKIMRQFPARINHDEMKSVNKIVSRRNNEFRYAHP